MRILEALAMFCIPAACYYWGYYVGVKDATRSAIEAVDDVFDREERTLNRQRVIERVRETFRVSPP